MICFALGISLRETLNNHSFQFNGKLYKQIEECAIGVGIAGNVAVLFMIYWDRELLRILKDNIIHVQLYSRYVDVIDIVEKSVN